MSTNVNGPLKIAAVVTSGAALAKGKRTPVDATSGAITMTLPTGATEGTRISVEKEDASVNVVTITGNIRGVGASSVSLAWQFESIDLTSDASGSWWPGPGHRTKASIDAAAGRVTKRVSTSLGAPRVVGGSTATADWAERIPIKLPVPTGRWRLRVANKQLVDTPGAEGRNPTTPFVVGNIYYGTPVVNASGRPTGAWTATPTLAAAGGNVPTDGTDWVSAWVTDPTQQFGYGTSPAMIGLNLTTVGGGTGCAVTATRYGFRNSGAGAASTVTATASTGYLGNTLLLDKRIEYEYVGANPIGLYVGASGTEGYNLGEETNPHLAMWESWPGAIGLRTKTPWINAGIFGATEVPFLTSTTFGFARFDLATNVPDFAVIDMGGNAVLGGQAIGTIQTNVGSVISAVRALGIKRVYLTTIVPLNYATTATAGEVLRVAYNTWVRSMPAGVDGVFDIDAMVRDPADTTLTYSGAPSLGHTTGAVGGWSASDRIHLLRGANQWIGSQITPIG